MIGWNYLFRWGEVPGKDSDSLIKLISRDEEWVKNAKIAKSEDNTEINISDRKKNYSFSLKDENKFLFTFSWDKIPGDDSDKLKEYLIQNFNVNWVKTANIKKNEWGIWRTINFSNGKNSLTLKFDTERWQLILAINGVRIDEFKIKTENGNLNIYTSPKVIFKTDEGRTQEFVAHMVNGKLTVASSVYEEEKDSLGEIGAISLFGAMAGKYLVYIIVTVGVIGVLFFGWKSGARDIFTFAKIIGFVLIPILLIITFIAFKVNPFEGKWRKVAAFVSLIPFVGIIPAAYFFTKKDGKPEDMFLGIICGILWIISLLFAFMAVSKGWIGYCAGNEFCINGISIKWDKIF